MSVDKTPPAPADPITLWSQRAITVAGAAAVCLVLAAMGIRAFNFIAGW